MSNRTRDGRFVLVLENEGQTRRAIDRFLSILYEALGHPVYVESVPDANVKRDILLKKYL